MRKLFNSLYVLHIFNDGFHASLVLLLPFIEKDLGITLTQVGFLSSTLSIFQIFLALPAAYMAVRMGSMRLLLIAAFLYSIGYLLASMTSVYVLLVLAFLVAGVGFGVFHPVAFAFVARTAEKATRGRQMGNFTAIGDLGRIAISSILPFLVAWIGWRLSAGIYGFIALLLCIGLSLIISRASHEKATLPAIKHFSFWDFFKDRRFMLATASNALDSFASGSLIVFLPFLLLQKGVSPVWLGGFTAMFFVGNFFGKALLGRFTDRYGNVFVFIASELLMALCIVIVTFTSSLALIIVVSIILGIFTKGTAPVVQTMISDAVEHHQNFEKAFGISQMISGIAGTMAPIVLGLVSDVFTIQYAFLVSALFALLAILPALGFKHARLGK